jgi:poly(A) polymerase
MDDPLGVLAAAGIEAYESSFTALDAYLGIRPSPLRFAVVGCELQDLAARFEGLRYPGTYYADAAVDDPQATSRQSPQGTRTDAAGAGELCILCVDSPKAAEAAAFAPLDLLRDPRRDVFLDPKGVYPSLRLGETEPRRTNAERALFETAVLVSRYPYEIAGGGTPVAPRDFSLGAQRQLLALMLTGPTPERGLEMLKESGFVDAYWPELAELAGLDQSKEFHPEGDAWAHTLETFRYRKLPALGLSLALLLHDVGKPRAEESEGRKFDRHAEIGRSVAERFLGRLGFAPDLIGDVSFLVRYHMMPAALPRLPPNRVEGIIDDPRFPILLELYKCDELSTFRGPDGYYEACAAYKAYLRNSRNPWRGSDGKKLARMYLEEGRPSGGTIPPRPRRPGPRK